MKFDPWKHEQKYNNWKENKIIKGTSKFNSNLIIEYLEDMEKGYNVGRPGARSYSRLNNLKQRMRWITIEMEKAFKKEKLTELTKKEVSTFFNDYMRNGRIKTRNGKKYTSVADYGNVFKAFWHWYQKKKEDETETLVNDITTYIDMSPVKESEFVYFTIDDLRRLAGRTKFEYKVLMWFLFDSGIRSPTELMNVRVDDLFDIKDSENYELNIREETAKTFGRKIKLLLCSQSVREYIQVFNLKGEDFLFQINPTIATRYIRRTAIKVFGDKKTKGGKSFKNIRMYDFRHSSACYWLPRYKSESALKYRFGWKENKMIHYYTKLLGMKDTIEESDILLESEAKTKLEKDLEILKTQSELKEERYSAEIKEIKKKQEKTIIKRKESDDILELFVKEIVEKYPNESRKILSKLKVTERLKNIN